MSGFDLSKYTLLSQYAVLAGNGITCGTSATPTVIYNGFWGTSGSTNTGAIYAGGVYPNGENNNPNATKAQEQLALYIVDIYSYASMYPLSPIGVQENQEAITFYPNKNYFSQCAALFKGSNLIFDAQGDPNAQFFITSSADLCVDTCGIHLINGAKACNVFWTSTYGNISFNCISDVAGVIAAKLSATFNGLNDMDGHIYANQGGVSISSCMSTTIYSATCSPVCYSMGTKILTKKGYVYIENLKVGDEVLTKGRIRSNQVSNGELRYRSEPIIWISSFSVKNASSNSSPICIRPNAFGKNMPFETLYVSPDHGMIVNGQKIAAKDLVNGKSIYQDTTSLDIEYYHLEVDSHSVLNANGAFAESYLECGNNRKMFRPTKTLREKIPQDNFVKKNKPMKSIVLRRF
jgi:hypothetical protein